MVASRGPRALLVLAPGGIVAVAELCAGALGVDVVAEGEDGSRYLAHKPCRFAVGLESHPAMSPAPTSVTVRGLPKPSTAVSTAARDASSIAEAIEPTTRTVLLIPSIPLVWGGGEK